MTILLFAHAWATAPIHGVSSQKGQIQSPFGPVQAQVLERVCRSESIVIGTVSNATSFTKVMTNNGVPAAKRTHTDLTLTIERTLRGKDSSSVDFTVVGGTLNGAWSPTPKTQPQPTIGARFMVGFTRMKVDTIPWPKGQPIFEGTFWIDSSVELPSAQTLAKELEASCANF